MANLSQQKRQRMLEFLDKIKAEYQDNDEMLMALGEIENELNSKKYGLVWEKHEEQVDIMIKDNIPVFTEVTDREVKAIEDNNYNFLLEGDNLHSLKLLEKTHKGKIDVIYIDPPYNTKNKEFIYGDKMIGYEDGYRHSKWLSFMSERIIAAKELLSEKGVLFISIDENEYCQLKLLCDDVFGEQNYLTTFIRKTKSMTGDDGNGLNIQHEYLHVYAKNKSKPYFVGDKKKLDSYSNPDNDPNGDWTSGDPSAKSGGESTYFPIENPYTGQIDYPPKGRYWAFSKETMDSYINSGRIKFKEKITKNQRGFIFKRYANKLQNKHMPVATLEFSDNSFMNSVATKEILNIFNTSKSSKFDYPKPILFIETLIKSVSAKDSTILDFFAGSGTTGHAVMRLNKEDGGNRKFILCTNNENNICEEVTYERLKRVINGYGDVEGIPANLKYYKTDFISKDAEDVSSELLQHIEEMVQLEQGIKIDDKEYKLVLSDEEADSLEKNWDNYQDLKAIYVSRDVLFTSTQNKLFSAVEIHSIPDYYFGSELKEVGESW